MARQECEYLDETSMDNYIMATFTLGTKNIGANSSAVFNYNTASSVPATYNGKSLQGFTASCNHDLITLGCNYDTHGITAFNHHTSAQNTTVVAYAWYK